MFVVITVKVNLLGTIHSSVLWHGEVLADQDVGEIWTLCFIAVLVVPWTLCFGFVGFVAACKR